MLPVFLQMPGEDALKRRDCAGNDPACACGHLLRKPSGAEAPAHSGASVAAAPTATQGGPRHNGRSHWEAGVELGVGLESSGWRLVSTVMSKNMRQ